MTNRLDRKLILVSFLILFLTILADTGFNIAERRNEYIRSLVLRAHALGDSLKGNLEYVIKMGLEVKELEGISQKCNNLVKTDPELSYCTVSDPEGHILFASRPEFFRLRLDHTRKTLVIPPSMKVAVIGNENSFYDLILPVMESGGKIVAEIHIGFPEKLITDRMLAMATRSFLILLAFFSLSFAFIVLFVKRSIMLPVHALLQGVKQISLGKLETRVPQLAVLELNELGEGVNRMASSLQGRDAELQRNYREMEQTHRELHDSYLKLESLTLELEKSEEQFKALLEEASDAILVIGDDRRIIMINRMAETFFGYSAHAISGMELNTMLGFINVEQVDEIIGLFDDAFRGKHVEAEMRFTRKDGTVTVGRIHASSIQSRSGRFVQAIIRDVTREKEILANLEKSAEDLARLNRMKDSFLGLASHELKTPLTVIIGYSDLILSELADNADPAFVTMVQHISNAAARLDAIIRDMVDVSMIDEKRLHLKVEAIDMNDLVRQALDELSSFFSMRKQQVELDLAEALPPVQGDSIRLVQLLSNVLGNALKFTPDGGTISVSTRSRNLTRRKRDKDSRRRLMVMQAAKSEYSHVEIIIHDTGIGIDEEDRYHIFEKFYEAGNIQEHSTGKTSFKGKGAGLGLTIAKGIVEMHGGEIWAESPGYDPEKLPGSTFHILLPIAPFVGEASIDYLNLFTTK